MALEAMTIQQELLCYNNRDFHNMLGVNWSCDFALMQNEEQGSFDSVHTEGKDYNGNWNSSPPMVQHLEQWGPNTSSERDFSSIIVPEELPQQDISTTMSTKPRRRRSRTKKNKEEIENQRMTHITVERNRRKQMNEYLSVLRGLMPDSYTQKGDQASIIGGAINYVKELEQQLHFRSGQKHVNDKDPTESSSPFAEFFTFPQYSTGVTRCDNVAALICPATDGNKSAAADIEVTIVDTHANLKIRSNKRLKQLSRIVCGLESLRLTILHLNVITADQTVLYSLSLKVEDDCRLNCVDEIAAAVNQMLGKIQEESSLI